MAPRPRASSRLSRRSSGTSGSVRGFAGSRAPRTGAAWVGTLSYGVYSQVQSERRLHAPLIEAVERDRYWPTDPKPDFSRPGLIVDLSRRMKVEDVGRCFTRVTPAGGLTRAGGPAHNQRYTAFLVSGPKRDVWTQGCPDQIAPGVWR